MLTACATCRSAHANGTYLGASRLAIRGGFSLAGHAWSLCQTPLAVGDRGDTRCSAAAALVVWVAAMGAQDGHTIRMTVVRGSGCTWGAQLQCEISSKLYGATIGVFCATALYFLLYAFFLVRAWRQLGRELYQKYRILNMVLRLQVRRFPVQQASRTRQMAGFSGVTRHSSGGSCTTSSASSTWSSGCARCHVRPAMPWQAGWYPHAMPWPPRRAWDTSAARLAHGCRCPRARWHGRASCRFRHSCKLHHLRVHAAATPESVSAARRLLLVSGSALHIPSASGASTSSTGPGAGNA